MSELKIYNLKNKKSLKKIIITKEEIQKIIEENSRGLVGITIIGSNLALTNKPNEVLQTLAYDEDYRLVVLEYRSGKFGSTINKGLVFLDYIRQNQGKIKSLLYEKLGEIANEINLNPRLISFGDDFNKYDDYAISQLPYDIDLIKYKLVEKDIIVLEKNYQHYRDILPNFKDENIKMYEKINEFVLSLGDEISKNIFNGMISYRKIKNFMYIIEEDNICVVLKIKEKYKKYYIKSEKDFLKIAQMIEECYDEN